MVFIAVVGMQQKAEGYDLEACAKDPMQKPEKINLLQPADRKMINCIPKIDSISSQWQSKANSIVSALNRVKMGNEGENDIEKLEYNTKR